MEPNGSPEGGDGMGDRGRRNGKMVVDGNRAIAGLPEAPDDTVRSSR